MVIQKIGNGSWVASFKLGDCRINVIANDRLSCIKMVVKYLFDVKGK